MIAKCRIKLDNDFMKEIEKRAVENGLIWRELLIDINLDEMSIEDFNCFSKELGDRFEVMSYEL